MEQLASAREQRVVHGGTLFLRQLVVEPVVAPRERGGDAEGGFIVVAAGSRAVYVPLRDGVEPAPGVIQVFFLARETVRDGTVLDRVERFLTIHVHLPPERDDADVVGIGQRLALDGRVHPRLYAALEECIPFGLQRGGDGLLCAGKIVFVQPDARTGSDRVIAVRAAGKRRMHGIRRNGEGFFRHDFAVF